MAGNLYGKKKKNLSQWSKKSCKGREKEEKRESERQREGQEFFKHVFLSCDLNKGKPMISMTTRSMTMTMVKCLRR